MKTKFLALLFAFVCAVLSSSVAAQQVLYVNPETGDDAHDGSKDKPFATAQKAIDIAEPGAVIHLLPKDGLYRQMLSFADKNDITVEGNGVTVSAADVLPIDGWEEVSEGLHRRKMDRLFQDRALLIVDGRMERMGRRPGSKIDVFPAPEALTDGQFALTPIDDKFAWLYVRGSLENLEWSTRMAGVATGRVNRNITIRNLHTCYALNDGFNIHGDCRGLRCINVSGYDNFDEGFSAHDTSEVYVESGMFYGNDNAIADVNGCESVYVDCTFRDSVSTDVYFSGGPHRLTNCVISASGANAVFIGSGILYAGKERTPMPVTVTIESTTIQSADAVSRPIVLKNVEEVAFVDCVLRGVTIERSNAGKVTATNTTLNGKPLELQ